MSLRVRYDTNINSCNGTFAMESLIFKAKFAEITELAMITNEQIRDLSGRRDALRRYL